MLHPRTFTVSDDLYRRITITAAALGLSSSGFIRGACEAALAECADRDPMVRANLAFLDERERVSA